MDGGVVATWALPGGVPTITPLEPVPKAVLDALRTDAADVVRYLGLPEKGAVIT